MQRIEGTLGKRGRPTGDKHDWVVTCYEECKTFSHMDALYVATCPHCRSMSFDAVVGTMPTYKVPDTDVIEAWQRHRFVSGMFMVANADAGFPEPPATVSLSNPDEQRTINNMKRNGLHDEIRKVEQVVGRESAFLLLDAIFCARAYVPEVIRQEARMRACMEIMKRSSSATVNLREHPTDYDLLDASHVDHIKVALIWLRVFARNGKTTK
jgi:hypothetical protein